MSNSHEVWSLQSYIPFSTNIFCLIYRGFIINNVHNMLIWIRVQGSMCDFIQSYFTVLRSHFIEHLSINDKNCGRIWALITGQYESKDTIYIIELLLTLLLLLLSDFESNQQKLDSNRHLIASNRCSSFRSCTSSQNTKLFKHKLIS